MILRRLSVVAACVHLILFAASIVAQEPTPSESEKFDPQTPGVLSSGKWQLRYDITAAGDRSEGRWGWLSFEGKRLPPANVNDFYETPWGRFYWVGSPAVRSGDHGWMPQPDRQAAKGKRLASPEEMAPDVEFTVADDGKTIEIVAGRLLAIRLEGNPTTGYRWQQAELTGKAIEAVGEPQYARKPVAPGIVGSGGEFVFLYKAVKAGEATVKLEYLRPWEKDTPAARSFGVTVKVAAAENSPAKGPRPAKEK